MLATFGRRGGVSFIASAEHRLLGPAPTATPGRAVARSQSIHALPCVSNMRHVCPATSNVVPAGAVRGSTCQAGNVGDRSDPCAERYPNLARRRHPPGAGDRGASRGDHRACDASLAERSTRWPSPSAAARADTARPAPRREAGRAARPGTPRRSVRPHDRRMRGCCDTGQGDCAASKHVTVTSVVSARRSRDCRQARRRPGTRHAPAPARAGGRPFGAMRTPARRRR